MCTPLRIIFLMSTERKSKRLGLSFPYDWSNPAISDEALILNVLKRGIYGDICRICVYFGLDAVKQSCADLPEDIAKSSWLSRMLDNIRKGFDRAATR
jgi:hypothetical protein